MSVGAFLIARSQPAVRQFGEWLRRHQGVIRITQWSVVAVYLVMVAVPAFLPLPDRAAHLWSNLTLFAQFVFWGVWWPFVLLSMIVVGRSWCGFFCPEGALSEFASRHGKAYALPRWLTWRGWPFASFALTTVYGQLVSVYQYPKPVLLVLGGSTIAAIAIGLLYGRNKRVWCRYLCPVNGVFALLSKLSPLHYRVDQDKWLAASPRGPAAQAPNCAPLVPLRTMRGASNCHMCGRCSGFRDAIALSVRAPNDEIVTIAGERPDAWQTLLILFGLLGIAMGAFHWSASPWYIAVKQAIAERLVDADIIWPLAHSAPWWLLTNYPAQNDVLTLLDGGLLIAYVAATALAMGSALALLLALAVRIAGAWSWARFHHLAQALIPVAGCGVFLGLSALSVTMLRAEGFTLPWVNALRAALLAGAVLWSTWLAWRIARHGAATACMAAAAMLAAGGWGLLFWVW